ncbi:hemicentin-2-like isoform X2 [Neocloeon triangulifer]|uniref:hemicentin-2-like isoform X2 n=1 Tax=Neocloeon triangulifer TaxID=2078957 RepID=UPI00286F2F88|nr:hemicentin-2-like isoform X2 [Neocloeon triangulifer]
MPRLKNSIEKLKWMAVTEAHAEPRFSPGARGFFKKDRQTHLISSAGEIFAVAKTSQRMTFSQLETKARVWRTKASANPPAQLGQERANNAFSEARCLSLPSHRPSDRMPGESVASAKDKKDAACTKLASAETKVCSSSAAPISAFGMTLLAAALLVHFLLLTSVARNDAEHQNVIRHRNGRSLRTGDSNQLSPAVVQPAIFGTENSSVVTASLGSTTVLPCTVKKFGNGVVSWIRRKDFHLLTVGLVTYSSDDRFFVEHTRHLQNWGLKIKSVQQRDSGFYECQVSSHPPTSIFIELRIVEASAEISGGAADLHIKSGSTLKLTCTLKKSTEPPVFVFWYHDGRMINYDKERGVRVQNAGRAGSALVLEEAMPADSGNYSCVPSNARPASINVHVLDAGDEKPAAMQHGSRTSSSPSPLGSLVPWCTFSSLLVTYLTWLRPQRRLLLGR